LYWKGLQKISSGQIGTSVLSLLAKKGGIQHKLTNIWLSPEAIELQLTKAQATFNCLKQDTKCWDTWLAGLIEAQAAQQGKSKWVIWKQLWATEKAHQMVQAVKAALAEPY